MVINKQWCFHDLSNILIIVQILGQIWPEFCGYNSTSQPSFGGVWYILMKFSMEDQ